MVALIGQHSKAYGVEPICAGRPIAPSTCYEQKSRDADPRRLPNKTQGEAALRPEIQRVWHQQQRCYGGKHTRKQLHRETSPVVGCTPARLGELSLLGPVRGRRCRTTIPDALAGRPQDLLAASHVT